MRQHVNPLSSFFQVPRKLPDLTELFERPSLPIHLDIGCARGKFLLDLACLNDQWNYLGVEIRNPLVIAAERESNQLGCNNLRFLFCNANVSLDIWLSSLPSNLLQMVTIQFPDPWFKRRHHKRRVLQPELLLSIAKAMENNGQIFIQSDLLSVVQPMVSLIEMSGLFDSEKGFSRPWLKVNPFPVASERENYSLQTGLQVYRALFVRNKQPLISLKCLQTEWDMKMNT